MKVAIVHDDLLQWGGAERVVAAMADIWPNADLFTSVADDEVVARHFANRTIHQSLLRHLPTIRRFRRAHFPLYPLAFQQFDFSDYDVIVSSTTRFAHTIRSRGTIHVAYFHAPPRYVWNLDNYLEQESLATLKKRLARPIIKPMTAFDKHASKAITQFVANSKNIAKKVQLVYKRKPSVIYPFVDSKTFTPSPRPKSGEYFLIVSRLVPWKRVDIAIAACQRLNVPLLVIGKGPDKTRLSKLACHSRTDFLEDLTDSQLVAYYRNCKALILPQEEDFGLVSLEAQACGKPVVAFGKGGVLETVKPNESGIFFRQQSTMALMRSLQLFDQTEFTARLCRSNALDFTKQRFQNQMKASIAAVGPK